MVDIKQNQKDANFISSAVLKCSYLKNEILDKMNAANLVRRESEHGFHSVEAVKSVKNLLDDISFPRRSFPTSTLERNLKKAKEEKPAMYKDFKESMSQIYGDER